MASLAQTPTSEGEKKNFVGYPIEKLLNCEICNPTGKTTAYFTYGRFQPGHRGHEVMIMAMFHIAATNNADVYVFVSPGGRPETEKFPEKNPLTPDEKVHLLQQQYEDYPAIHFVNMGQPKLPDNMNNRSAFAAASLLQNCYEQVIIVRGNDLEDKAEGEDPGEEEDIKKGKLSDTLLKSGLITGAIALSRPKTTISATKLREAATKDPPDLETFYGGIRFGNVSESLANNMLNKIREKYGMEKHRFEGGSRRRHKTRRKTRRHKTRRHKTKRKRKRKRKRKTRRGRKKVTKSKKGV